MALVGGQAGLAVLELGATDEQALPARVYHPSRLEWAVAVGRFSLHFLFLSGVRNPCII